MCLDEIIKTKQELENMGYCIENNIIEFININTIAHFGNCTCLEIACSNVWPMSSYNNTRSLGYLIKAFIELFDISNEDGLRLTDIKNIPCRLVFNGRNSWGSQCIGFGHFMKDKFVLTEEFAKVNE